MATAITTESAQALKDGEEFRRGNTRVENGEMHLHGQLIVKVHDRDARLLIFTPAGNPSRVTKDRLVGVFDAFGIEATMRLRMGGLRIRTYGSYYEQHVHQNKRYLIGPRTFQVL